MRGSEEVRGREYKLSMATCSPKSTGLEMGDG